MNRILVLVAWILVAGTLHAQEPVPAPVPTPSPTPSALTNPVCTKIMTIDGNVQNGFLWKAQDLNGKLAILFPQSFKLGFQKVWVKRVWKFVGTQLVYRKNPIIERCVVGGFGNGDRQHVRCPYSGGYYDGHVWADDGTQTCEWQVPCPGVRQD